MKRKKTTIIQKKPITITGLSLAAAIALPYILYSNTSAATSINDNVSISIDAHCSFRSTGTAVATDKTFEANGFNGREVTFNDGGKHDFNVLCNHETGYTIKAYATDLVNDEDKTIPFVNFTNYITEGNNSNWTAEITNGSAGAVFGATEEDAQAVFATNTISADQGENFSVTYKAYVGATATPGTYSGTATYILSTNPLPDPTPVMPTFQTFTTAQCNDIPVGDTIEVKDERDQKTYLVSRLKMSAADTVGRCWMVQNLALDQGQELTPANSDISSNYVIPSTTAFNSASGQDAIVPSHKDAQIDAADNTGGYYTYATATAGANPSSGEASTSICPNGWKLPAVDDFTNMYSGYNSTFNDTFKNAWHGVLLGNYYDNSFIGNGSNAYWWSRVAVNDNGAYSADQYSTSFAGTGNHYKKNGFSVRCIFGS